MDLMDSGEEDVERNELSFFLVLLLLVRMCFPVYLVCESMQIPESVVACVKFVK